MTQFQDLDQFFDGALELPIAGRVYRVEPPDAELGLWLERMLVTGVSVHAAQTDAEIEEQKRLLGNPPGDPNKSLQERLLGAAYEQMLADGVPWPQIKIAGSTALLYATVGEEAAVAFWTSGGRPGKAPEPANRAERRQTSNRTAAAKKTQPPASTSGTTSRKTSNQAKAASRSRGGTS